MNLQILNKINKVELNNINDIEEEEDDIDETAFTDDNEEFIEFKNNVKQWLTLDDDILTLQKAIKERKVKKDELTPKILDFMNKFKINDLNTQEGKIKFTKSTYTKPLNKQYLITRLGNFFKDFTKGERAAAFILENRDKEEKFKLRRVANK